MTRFAPRIPSSAMLLLGLVLSMRSVAAPLPASRSDEIARGAYLARAADCIACHTANEGAPYAGGLAIVTPIGKIYSTNITPDVKTGIGSYTLADFDRALRRGQRPDGSWLYPAMPYPNYAGLTDRDVTSLYAYFMRGVPPVVHVDRGSDIRWPLSMRWPLRIWRMAFGRESALKSARAEPSDRGAYLVEVLGHCGACHTPRGMAMQERARSAAGGASYLAGGPELDGWIAPTLRGDPGLLTWTPQDIALYLRDGRNGRAAAFGAMADVIAHSTRFLNEADRLAIARYIKTLPPVSDPITSETGSTKLVDDAGYAVYQKQCAFCHQADGQGVPRLFPALDRNGALLGPNPDGVIRIILQGGVLPPSDQSPSSVVMPAYGTVLSDADVAAVTHYVRSAWHNDQSGAIDPSAVRRERATAARMSGSDLAAWPVQLPQPVTRSTHLP